MTGRVDEAGRALLVVPVSGSRAGLRETIEAWVDTAFTGGLTMPKSMAAGLGLSEGVSSDAILADGSQVALESFVCYLDWFDNT